MILNFLKYKINSSLLFLLFSLSVFSQSKILVYHETNGFRHSSIGAGLTMFEDLGGVNGWTTDNSQDSNVFNASNLAQYDVVVFLNTSGTDLLSSSEEAAFEDFIASGKGFIGIHAATDTYRDKVWPFYNELVGGIVQNSPNHTSAGFNADMEVKSSHPITDFLGPIGSIWNKNEEYNYWQINGGQLSTDNTVLLEVESTGINSYDAARPTTWYKESITYDHDNNSGTANVTLSGIRSFYTGLGHDESDYTSNTNFRTIIKNATLWAIGNTLSIGQNEVPKFRIIPNPTRDKVKLFFSEFNETVLLKVYDVTGKQMFNKVVSPKDLDSQSLDLSLAKYTSGVYFFNIYTPSKVQSFKVVKN
jgi:uncharacterized protein